MWPNPQFTTDLIIFTEEILIEKLHFLCSDTFGEHCMKRIKEILRISPHSVWMRENTDQKNSEYGQHFLRSGMFNVNNQETKTTSCFESYLWPCTVPQCSVLGVNPF